MWPFNRPSLLERITAFALNLSNSKTVFLEQMEEFGVQASAQPGSAGSCLCANSSSTELQSLQLPPGLQD